MLHSQQQILYVTDQGKFVVLKNNFTTASKAYWTTKEGMYCQKMNFGKLVVGQVSRRIKFVKFLCKILNRSQSVQAQNINRQV